MIPTKDRPTLVPAAATAAAAASPAVLEIVVVDDGDVALDTITPDRASTPTVDVVRGARVGVSAARNLGVSATAGDWLVFADDDDRLLAGWADDRVLAALDDPTTGFVATGYRRAHDGTEVLPMDLGPAFGGLGCAVLTGSWVVRRSVFEAAGGYDAELRHSENYELLLRVAEGLVGLGMRGAVVPVVGLEYGGEPDDPARGSNDGSARADAAERLLALHGTGALARSPAELAGTARTGGVAAARSGQLQRARRLFLVAARAGSDERWRDLVRWVVASNRFSSARVWGHGAATR